MILHNDSQPPFQLISELLNRGINLRVHRTADLSSGSVFTQEIRMAVNSSAKVIWLDSEPFEIEARQAVIEAEKTGCLVLQIHESSAIEFMLKG